MRVVFCGGEFSTGIGGAGVTFRARNVISECIVEPAMPEHLGKFRVHPAPFQFYPAWEPPGVRSKSVLAGGKMTGLGKSSIQRSAFLHVSRNSRLASLAAVVLGALLLASCGGAPEPVVGVAGNPYTITEVDVIITKNVVYGAEMADGSSPQELGRQVQAAMKRKLTAELVEPRTSKMPARLEVVLDHLDMSSALGRTLLKRDSMVGGSLVLVDKRTRAVIARRDGYYINDDSIKAWGGGTGTAGGIAAIGALMFNAAQSSDESRIASVVDPFTAGVMRWLGRAKE